MTGGEAIVGEPVLRRVTRSVAIPTLDQALASLAPFVGSVLLARQVGPTEFGLFAILYAAQALCIAAYQGFVIDPMMVFAQKRPPSYLRSVLTAVNGRLLLIGLVAVALLASGLIAWSGDDLALVLPVMASFVGTSMLMLARRIQYARGTPARALAASAAYFVALTLAFLWLSWADRLDVMTAFTALAVCAIPLGLLFSWVPGPGGDSLAWSDHKGFGAWAATANLLSWIPLNIQFYLLSWSHGLAESGELRALYNLVLPAQLALANLSFVIIPLMVRREGLRSPSHRSFWLLAAAMTGIAGLYLVAIAVLGPWLLELVYDGKYEGFGPLLILSAVPIFSALHVVFSSALRARGDPRGVTIAYLQLMVGLPAVFILTQALGLLGSALAMLALYAALNALTFVRLKKGEAHAVV